MLNSDFALRAATATQATKPAMNGGATSGLYRELHAEVMGFIENGGGAAVANAQFTLSPEAAAIRQAVSNTPSEEQQAFLDRIAPLAAEAGEKLGVSPDLIKAQAALETGWGQSKNGNNLFGIKATGGWRGDVHEAATTEYEGGVAQERKEAFRAYPDAAASVRDFTELLLKNPRYKGALQAGADAQAYAQALQRGGYATDPAYADKLVGVAKRIQGAR